MTEAEKGNQNGISGRNKPSSGSPLLPFLGVRETVCGCIAKMPRPCTRKKLGANLSDAEIELLVAQAMGFLHLDNTVEAAELMVNCATTSFTMAPPLASSTLPTTELAERTTSNAAVAGAVVAASATSNVAIAASATSVVTVIGGTGVAVGATVLVHTVLNPVYIVLNMNKPTPIPSPHPTIIPKVQCPDAGAAMFVGYKVSNTSEDSQLLMVTLTDLPERLELFLTNSFSLPTMSEEFAGNKTGSVKMIIPSGGFSAGTLFGYESPALAISDNFMWQSSASGFTLPEQGSDVLLYCRDDWRTMKIAFLSYGMTQEDVP
eukprot:scaffold120155_cov29-Attheya_sp.AAC.1